MENHADFLRRLRTRGKGLTHDLNKACNRVLHSEALQFKLGPEKDFENILGDMSIHQLQDCVAQHLAKLEAGDAQLSANRAKGWRKATSWLLPFAKTFGQFLKSYSGIVSIFNSVDAQYGNVATAALSLLFAVRRKFLVEDGH